MPEVEFVLPVDIRELHICQQTPLIGHFLVQRRAGNRRIEHELVEVGRVADRRFDLLGDVLWRVMLQADDGRALYSYPVFAKLSRELRNVLAF